MPWWDAPAARARGANDIWVSKISPDGKLIWWQSYGSDRLEQAHWVEATDDGGMVVLGFSNGLVPRGGRHDFLLMKLDANGLVEWRELYGSVNREIGFCVKKNLIGGYAMLGYTKSYGNWGDILPYRGRQCRAGLVGAALRNHLRGLRA